jgi:hypothetical protein
VKDYTYMDLPEIGDFGSIRLVAGLKFDCLAIYAKVSFNERSCVVYQAKVSTLGFWVVNPGTEGLSMRIQLIK